MLKLAQTDQQTDQQTGQKQYVPHYTSNRPTDQRTDQQTGQKHYVPHYILTNFTLIQAILRTNILAKFHEEWAKSALLYYIHIRKTAPPSGRHVFQRTGTFSNSADNGLKVKTAPPSGRHVFQRTGTFSNSAEVSLFQI
ncbi:hypothetical protein DPMN_112439 [Dreissena polymorpha]|uniref:Uncharacterized protein n=1 Tax=Dreissena polymorpha TaxID=45954 RepID=A0A9D4KFN1_DREPO|nr:hypothetical protein DPMN_112438 [Dreissena polymorpha]KAH3839018.1 hypothetical protein DPMN_112439 [Dreissena polymorpha]